VSRIDLLIHFECSSLIGARGILIPQVSRSRNYPFFFGFQKDVKEIAVSVFEYYFDGIGMVRE
jgi:hypothetical protein